MASSFTRSRFMRRIILSTALLVLGLSLPGIWTEGAGDYPWLFAAHAWLAFGMIAVTGVANALYIWLRARSERWLK
mgnify:CR=1 FL=1